MAGISGVQLCFDSFAKRPGRKTSAKKLLSLQGLSDTKEDRQKLGSRIYRARVMLRDQRQMLLRSGDDYWIAQPKVDVELVESRLELLLRRTKSADKVFRTELSIARERDLASGEALSRIEKAAATPV